LLRYLSEHVSRDNAAPTQDVHHDGIELGHRTTASVLDATGLLGTGRFALVLHSQILIGVDAILTVRLRSPQAQWTAGPAPVILVTIVGTSFRSRP
jgi:hypothetical protein